MSERKIEISFDADALRVIEELKKVSGKKTTIEVLNDALSLYYWAQTETNQGNAIYSTKDFSFVKEAILPRNKKQKIRKGGIMKTKTGGA